MNFLGHCFICQDYPHLIAGNLAGDSYKGNLDNFNHLPKAVLDGIKLHRFIDDFTDQSDQIKKVAHIFQNNGVSKVSYIACDILLDHYLAKNWTQFSTFEYNSFIKKIYSETEQKLNYLEPEFHFLFSRMKEYDWLSQYPYEKGIELVLWQFSKRLGFKNNLVKCMSLYINHKTEIELLFKTFLSDIKEEAQIFILENKFNIL